MNHIEEKIIQTIDEHRDEIIAFAKDIQSHPEPGFYEERTAAHVAAFLRGLGLRVHLVMQNPGRLNLIFLCRIKRNGLMIF